MKPECQEQEEELRRFRRLVRLLSHVEQPQRERARRAIQQMGAEAIDPLLILLEEEARKRRRRLRLHRKLGILLLVELVAIVVSAAFDFSWLSRLLMFLFCLLNAIVTFLDLTSDRHKAVARVLAEQNDLRTVGPLIEAGSHLIEVREEIEAALIRLLPRLKTSDSALLTSVQRTCLHTALQSENASFVVTVLQVLEQVGDGDALPHVEKLIGGKSKTAPDARVQEAAHACLPFLQQRAEQEHAAATLL